MPGERLQGSPGLGAQVVALDVPPGVVVHVLDGEPAGQIPTDGDDGVLVVDAEGDS